MSTILSLGEEFLELRRERWQIKTSDNRVVAPADLSRYPAVRQSPLAIAKIAWGLTILDPTAFPAQIRRRGNDFFIGRNRAVHLSRSLDGPSLIWLEKQFAQFTTNVSFQAAEADNVKIPSSPEEALTALELLEIDEKNVLEKVLEFNRLRKEVDDLVAELYDIRKI
ncbi:MAG: hypothetical protein WKF92_06925 [Pyrinomonadaceae bacterium]